MTTLLRLNFPGLVLERGFKHDAGVHLDRPVGFGPELIGRDDLLLPFFCRLSRSA